MTTYAQRATARSFPDHRCPDALERDGDLRPGYHGPDGAALLYVTLIPPACGCKVVGSGTLQHPVMIEPCIEHGPSMYPTLATENERTAATASAMSAAERDDWTPEGGKAL